MKLIRDFAKYVYTTFVPEDERQAEAVNIITDEARVRLATAYFSREAVLLPHTSAEYQRALGAAEGLILSHHGASSFNQLCRSHVRRTSSGAYYYHVVLGLLLQEATHQQDEHVYKSSGAASRLLVRLADTMKTVAGEKSFVKRRSQIRNAIKAEVPTLDSDKLTLAVELVIAINSNNV